MFLHMGQQEVLRRSTGTNLIVAGRRWGKSEMACWLAATYPNYPAQPSFTLLVSPAHYYAEHHRHTLEQRSGQKATGRWINIAGVPIVMATMFDLTNTQAPLGLHWGHCRRLIIDEAAMSAPRLLYTADIWSKIPPSTDVWIFSHHSVRPPTIKGRSWRVQLAPTKGVVVKPDGELRRRKCATERPSVTLKECEAMVRAMGVSLFKEEFLVGWTPEIEKQQWA